MNLLGVMPITLAQFLVSDVERSNSVRPVATTLNSFPSMPVGWNNSRDEHDILRVLTYEAT